MGIEQQLDEAFQAEPSEVEASPTPTTLFAPSEALPGDWAIPRAPGRRAQEPLSIEFVRVLTPGDLEMLRNPPRGEGGEAPRVATLRHTHHRLAQLLAQGHDHATVALITGYSQGRISQLCKDPSFAELLTHYASISEAKFIDVLERMKALGLDTLEELQERLDQRPEAFANRELMELAELLIHKPMSVAAGARGTGPAQPPVTLNVKFVAAEGQGLTIDGEAA
jgi:hypothetical protein